MPPLIWTEKKKTPQNSPDLLAVAAVSAAVPPPAPPHPTLHRHDPSSTPPFSLSPPVSLALILSFISSCQVSSRRRRSLYPSFLLCRSGRVINMEGGGPPKPLDPPRLFFIFTIPSFCFVFKKKIFMIVQPPSFVSRQTRSSYTHISCHVHFWPLLHPECSLFCKNPLHECFWMLLL